VISNEAVFFFTVGDDSASKSDGVHPFLPPFSLGALHGEAQVACVRAFM
jgi:hypothetical protein